jgi:subtilase family serine protease
MITKHVFSGFPTLRICGWMAACTMAVSALAAQTPAPRIRSEVNNSEITPLKSTFQPQTQGQVDAGRMPADTRIKGITIAFNRSVAQQADLDALIAAQQNPSSPLYHQWLNPDQFAVRFGMAQSDIDKVQGWLQQQGFSIDSVSRSKTFIRFSGTVGQVELAFRTQMHYFQGNGATHYAPSTVLSVPTAIAPTVESVRNLSDFRPHPMHIHARPGFTSSVSGSVFFAPGDIATAYDIKPLYSGAINGTGQSIAVIGQSAISVSDVENFQNAAGLSVNDPTMVLMPGTGGSTIFSGGDEGESDLDVEWSGAIAPGAKILFVYTGSNTNFSAFDAIQYAIDESLAPIVSISYGACETALNGFSLESAFQQAVAQGQSIVAASGDQGATACSGDTVDNLTTTQEFALAVNYPASSQYVTAVGGTEISQADDSTGSGFWQATSGSDITNSLLKYIPEIAWNDNSSQFGLSSSGGGASALFTKPSWQKGVPGIPSDGKRDVPDVALYASPGFPGYLFCTSDQADWNTSNPPFQVASCNSGFRDSSTEDLTVAGGTSFGTPIFAGMLALINQKAGFVAGMGLANPTLYTLASNSTTYASAFHDVTSGNNDCNAGSTYCGSTTGGFSAGAGYDQVTGLGSVDLDTLAGAWPASTSALTGTTTTVAASNSSVNVNTNDSVTITVAADKGASTPTGTLTLDIDGGAAGGGSTTTATLTANGTATYTAQFSTAGAHQIVALYPGDATFAASTGVVTITVNGVSSGTGSFTLAATGITVAQGSAGTSTITVTPKSGYTGTIDLTFDSSNDSALTNLCYNFTTTLTNGDGTVTVTGASAVTTQLQFDTNASDCLTGAAQKGTGSSVKGSAHVMHRFRPAGTAKNTPPSRAPALFALAGLLLVGFFGRHSRKLRVLVGVVLLASIGFAVSGCGSYSGTSVSNPPKGTYTITLTGTDSTTASITANTTFTFVIN